MKRYRISNEQTVFTGQHDKNGNPIFSGDWVRYYLPRRHTQTHTDPYCVEPLEPYIEERYSRVEWVESESGFYFHDSDSIGTGWNDFVVKCQDQKHESELCDAFECHSKNYWSAEDGDFQYLVEEYGERFGFETEKQLAWLLTGVEVVDGEPETKHEKPRKQKRYNIPLESLVRKLDLPF